MKKKSRTAYRGFVPIYIRWDVAKRFFVAISLLEKSATELLKKWLDEELGR